jgi:hypothetical protein
MESLALSFASRFIDNVFEAGFAIQFIVLLCLFLVALHNAIEYITYIHTRRHTTVYRSMSFVEGILSNIHAEAMSNSRAILLKSSNGTIGEREQKELEAYNIAITLGLLLVTKNKIRDIFNVNGYVRLFKDEKANEKEIERRIAERGVECRNISLPYVNSIIGLTSPLAGQHEKRFSTEKAVELMALVVKRHVDEVRDEERDIQKKCKQLFPIVHKFIQYQHEE